MTRRRLLRAIAPAVAALTLAAVAPAQPGRGWELLGEAHVDGGQDHDVIRVTARKGDFKAIRIRVEDAAIDFDRVVIHFGNGADVPVQLRSKIRAGGQTRVIDLPGRDRVIESVEFWYGRGNWSKRARPKLTLYGRH